ncbi:MAG: DUF1800 domain-containing protein [Pseudomonadota bacterium]
MPAPDPSPSPDPDPDPDPDPEPEPEPPVVSSVIETAAEASAFLTAATFGPSQADIDAIIGEDAADWVQAEFQQPFRLKLPVLLSQANQGSELDNRAHAALQWDAMIEADDQLRQRVVFALSQLFVVSDRGLARPPLQTAYFIDLLTTNAFGNFRDLMQDVTYSPIMARYLTYIRNRKGNPNTGRTPDENYAREVMQLFTIGLVELNLDGTPRLAGGQPVETYTNDDILGLARVFTGLSYAGDNFFGRPDPASEYAPLQSFPEYHSELEKSFLGTTIPAGTGPDASISTALDTLFNHPNVGPFIGRQLIQRLTASHPDPAYVARVATAFNNGSFTTENGARFGSGTRGDMQAVIAAILLDQSRNDLEALNGQSAGKLRSPVLRFVHWVRAFNVSNINSANEWRLRDSSNAATRLGQQPFRPPSVFNFYRPGFVAPGTESGSLGLTAPELQIMSATTSVGYARFIDNFVRNRTGVRDNSNDTFVPDYSTELALADRPEALVDHLSNLLTGGRMTNVSKDRMAAILAEIPIRENRQEQDLTTRVHVAVALALFTPAYFVQP